MEFKYGFALVDASGGLLEQEYVDEIAADLQPGNSVGVMCWENTWAVALVGAQAFSGAVVIDQARIPRDAVLSALATSPTS